MAVGQQPSTGGGSGEAPGPRGAVATDAPPEEMPAAQSAVVAAPEILANNLGDYVKAWWQKVRLVTAVCSRLSSDW